MSVSLPVDYEPEFDSMKELLLKVADTRSVDELLQRIVTGLNARPHVALARIWLKLPGDVCPECPMRDVCPDQTACLHLVASRGKSRVDPDADWSRIDGAFRRIPIGVGKIGRIASTAESFNVLPDTPPESWSARPEWIVAEGIEGFASAPIVYRGEVLGVLGVFIRVPVDDDPKSEGRVWLRMLADHAAVAIVSARAYEEVDLLRHQLTLENEYLREEVNAAQEFGEIVGESEALGKALAQVELVAPTDTTVMITGESGTGKELMARAIHARSSRDDTPMIKVNCASVPRELFESEFFGHVKGAYTGALRDREGRFGLADGGTLFLDEVGEIPIELQAKLLRVLQEGAYERLGEERTRQTDVRVIAATNRDLQEEVAAGRFRRDLYYRLSVFPIEVPPLRERRDDIPLLATHLLRQSCMRLGIRPIPLKPRHVRDLQAYPWPGNVRELQNVMERAAIASRAGALQLEVPRSTAPVAEPAAARAERELLTLGQLKTLERDNILEALRRARWRVSGRSGAAELLGMNASTLASRIRALKIQRPV